MDDLLHGGMLAAKGLPPRMETVENPTASGLLSEA